MILYYIYQDIGAHNIFKRTKYSIMHAREAIKRCGRDDVKIHVDYVRNIGRNPQYDTAALTNKAFIDSFQISMFDTDCSINYGWPVNDHKRYIKYAMSVDDQVVLVHSDMFIHKVFDIPKNSFLFWKEEGIWVNVVWGFETENDANKFFDFCNSNGYAEGRAKDYTVYVCSLFHIPRKYLPEFHEKLPPMLDFILDMYKDKYYYQVTCSLASSICCSIIAQEIMQKDNISSNTIFMKGDALTRYTAEIESDIAGGLRMFFD